ncbi:hypothetical protein SDC9_94562 [bioreactor metagenome]|uniref:Uncharacterized protein n=1 Tax=bioreactor metagenome TaxID=1076179 RepID=A0A645A6E2_9ZZZZ
MDGVVARAFAGGAIGVVDTAGDIRAVVYSAGVEVDIAGEGTVFRAEVEGAGQLEAVNGFTCGIIPLNVKLGAAMKISVFAAGKPCDHIRVVVFHIIVQADIQLTGNICVFRTTVNGNWASEIVAFLQLDRDTARDVTVLAAAKIGTRALSTHTGEGNACAGHICLLRTAVNGVCG